MRNVIEFRLTEADAQRYLNPSQGVVLPSGTVRKIVVVEGSHQFDELKAIATECYRRGERLFTSWMSRREYTAKELEIAQLFTLKITKVFEPAGEECGTTYDDPTDCTMFGGKAKQASDLYMEFLKIPKKYDFSKTIGGEILVSKSIRNLIQSAGLSGVIFGPVRSTKGAKLVSDSWFQLIPSTCSADVVPPTRIGINPFDNDDAGKYRCEKCGVLGLNLLSEAWVKIKIPQHDLIKTWQIIGCRRGLLRPEPLLLVSQRLRETLVQAKAKGCLFEVAHVLE